jgi:6-pyruvoyl-tetrahydropterin synthase
MKSLKTLSQLDVEQFRKYSVQKHSLGLTSEDYETPDSPYSTLRDLVLSQGDFVKRQYDIIRFKTQFTYENLVSDDPSDSAWLYCNVSGVRLLPSFLYTLASAFVYDPDSYIDVLETLCKEIGTESDDGENWVDKYTGYVIRPKQFDIEEGYTQDGYKMKTREVMETQMGSAVYLAQDKPKQYSSQEAELIARSIRALAALMGVDTSAHEDFIIRNVLLKLKQTMPSKEDYEKEMARRAAKQEKKVKVPSYKDSFNAKLLLLTFAYFIVSIQTSIPPVVVSRTFPGCRVALHGYPIDGDQDKSTVTYIACLAQSLKKTKTEPWNAISSASEAAIVKQVVSIIDTNILTDPDMVALFDEKKAYIKEQVVEEIPAELDIRQWVNFLPPLVVPKPPTKEPLADSFKQKFAKHLKEGSPEQFADINALQTRIRDFSIQIQELVGKVVNGDKALLKLANAAYLTQNACCDTTTTGCFDYFAERQPDIIRLNR